MTAFDCPIEWNGHLLGYLREIESETLELALLGGRSKFRGRWVPLDGEVSREYLRQLDERRHLAVRTGLDKTGSQTLFCTASDDEAWILIRHSPWSFPADAGAVGPSRPRPRLED